MEKLKVTEAGMERRQQLIYEMLSVLPVEVGINPISTNEEVDNLLKQVKEIYYPRIEASDVADILYSLAEKKGEDENSHEGEVDITSARIYAFINRIIPKEKKLELSRAPINGDERVYEITYDTVILLDEKTCLDISIRSDYLYDNSRLVIDLYKGIEPLKFRVKKACYGPAKYNLTLKGVNSEKKPIFLTNDGTEKYQDKELASIIKPISVEELKELIRKIEEEFGLPAIKRERQARN